jgi:hypothetical protein
MPLPLISMALSVVIYEGGSLAPLFAVRRQPGVTDTGASPSMRSGRFVTE